jgi:hypothetical protein
MPPKKNDSPTNIMIKKKAHKPIIQNENDVFHTIQNTHLIYYFLNILAKIQKFMT